MNNKIEVNGEFIELKINEVNSYRTIPRIKSDIFNWLSRIGISKDYISIEYNHYNYENPFAEIRWVINGEEFYYKCSSQKNATKCLAAIEQLVHYEVIFIERGIKSFGQVMNQFRLGYNNKKLKSKSPHEVIGISEHITDLNYITYVYKKKAKLLHPDNGGNGEEMSELNEAYNILKEVLK